MQKQISIYKDRSLSELDWKPGELIAFDSTDLEFPQPFLLAIPDKLVRSSEEDFSDFDNGIKLLYCADDSRENWTLYFRGNTLGLWSPRYKGSSEIPNFVSLEKWHGRNPYFVEYALSGKKSIINYLQNSKQGLAFYAECMRDGKLITERNQLEKFVERLGLESILPRQLRFKR